MTADGWPLASPADLDCSEILIRLLRRRSSVSEFGVMPTEFHLHPGSETREPDLGLSMVRVSLCNELDARERYMPHAKGWATLHVGHIRDLGLRIHIDPGDSAHVEVRGLRRPGEDDPANETDQLASALGDHARGYVYA
jgi:hypothetical protein